MAPDLHSAQPAQTPARDTRLTEATAPDHQPTHHQRHLRLPQILRAKPCRFHHLLQDVLGLARRTTPRRHPDLDRPTGQKTVTHPGSALIFPTLCAPTGPLTVGGPSRDDRAGDKTAKMPRRQRTRTQQRTAAILAERHANHQHHTNPNHHSSPTNTSNTTTPSPPKTPTHHPSEWGYSASPRRSMRRT